MFDFIRRWLRKQDGEASARCRECGKNFRLSELVFVNACYHDDIRHKTCMGFRELCNSCHKQLPDPLAYYSVILQAKAIANPDQYPWDNALKGLSISLRGQRKHETAVLH